MPLFDPNDKQHLDTLFALTQRGAFTGYAPDQIALETNEVEMAPGSVTEDQRWPLYLQTFVFDHCYNGKFDSAPPDGTGTDLTSTNVLPGWTFVDATSNASGAATWTGTGTTQAKLEFKVGAGCSVNDEVYVSQLIYFPEGNIKPFNFAAKMNGYEAASGLIVGTDFNQFIRVRWLYYDGSEISNVTTTYEKGDTEAGFCRQWWSTPPANAVYAQLEIGYRVLATGSLSGTETLGALHNVDFERPETSYAILRFSYGEAVAHETLSASTTYTMESQPGGTHEVAGKLRCPAPGFVMGLSVATDSTISAGKLNFRPVTNGTGFDWNGDDSLGTPGHWLGHDVNGAGIDYLNYATQGKRLVADVDYDFLNGEALQLEMVADSSWSGTAGCFVATMLVMFVWHEVGSKTSTESLDAIAYRGG